MIKTDAPLSTSLFMMEREFPSYLSTAYSLRYGNEPSREGGILERIYTTIQRYFSLIKELYFYRPCCSDLIKNTKKLDSDFEKMCENIAQNTKPILAYLVSSHDENGAILGDHLYYYHHYKIKKLEEHYAVAPKVIRFQDETKEFLDNLKRQYPGREIKVVDLVTHGGRSLLGINQPSSENPQKQTFISPSNLQDAAFESCAPDASIILDACGTGLGHRNIADEIARKNPGKTVFAPGPSLAFSKPVISTASGIPKIEHVVHGFALVNAYSCNKFHYAQAVPTPPSFTKDEHLMQDALNLLTFGIVRSSCLDSFIDFTSEEEKNNVLETYKSLSQETRTLIKYQIWKNNGEPLDRGDDFGGDFLKANPLDKTVLSAFRKICNELKEDTIMNSDYVGSFQSGLIKVILWAKEAWDLFRARLKALKTPR